MRGEPLGVAGEHQAGARGFRRRNLAVEPAVPRERLELQGIAPLLEQVAHLGHLHAPRRRMGDLSSWRRTLATARFRALLWSAARAVPTCNTPRAAWSRTSTVGRPWSASNTTRASCGRGATRARACHRPPLPRWRSPPPLSGWETPTPTRAAAAGASPPPTRSPGTVLRRGFPERPPAARAAPGRRPGRPPRAPGRRATPWRAPAPAGRSPLLYNA